jgi:hypothetical protein
MRKPLTPKAPKTGSRTARVMQRIVLSSALAGSGCVSHKAAEPLPIFEKAHPDAVSHSSGMYHNPKIILQDAISHPRDIGFTLAKGKHIERDGLRHELWQVPSDEAERERAHAKTLGTVRLPLWMVATHRGDEHLANIAVGVRTESLELSRSAEDLIGKYHFNGEVRPVNPGELHILRLKSAAEHFPKQFRMHHDGTNGAVRVYRGPYERAFDRQLDRFVEIELPRIRKNPDL